MRRRESSDGFTLLEVLVVVGIIGILASIALANYLNAMTRSRQKRTMADQKAVATAWEARATDAGVYNAAGFSFPAKDFSEVNMRDMLTPTYIANVPIRDGWERPLDFAADADIGSGIPAGIYAIRSRGRDGNVDTTGTYPAGATTRFDCDIIFSNGTFVVYPEGVMIE